MTGKPGREAPVLTVVMATYGRGRHILPSVLSVLRQSFDNFELIVVGDCCTDETEAVIAGIADPRLRWINLAARCGSQSAPNNAGIAAARGGIIAYLGHDDIWEPAHLAHLSRVFQVGVDFGVSGVILHTPGGVPGSSVHGIFGDDSAKHRYFFPPGAFAHRKAISDLIGPLQMPMVVRAPVDEDFLLRAAAAGLAFASTGGVTVHKFTSAHRYLRYVEQRSAEQEAMLSDLDAPGHQDRVAAVVSEARLRGKFMTAFARVYTDREPGELERLAAANRGVLRPDPQPLGRGAVIRQTREPCALDWRNRPVPGIRLHTLNPTPRFLLPYTATGRVALTIRAVHPARTGLGTLVLSCNGVEVAAKPVRVRRSLWGWAAIYRAELPLRQDRASVLEFLLSAAQREKVGLGSLQIGFGIGRLRLSGINVRSEGS